MRPSPLCARALKIVFFLATAASITLLTGCPEKTIVMNPGQVSQAKYTGSKKTQAAKEATSTTTVDVSTPITPKMLYEQGQYAQAEKMGSELVTKSNISAEDKTEAWKYYALSASANKHVHLAGKILEDWSQEEPGVENSSPWQDAWFDVTMRLPALQAVEKANERMSSNPPANMQARAQAVLALKAASKEEAATGLNNMAANAQYLSGSEKSDMEGSLATQLSFFDNNAFESLKQSVTPANTYTYPYSVIAFENGRRLAISGDASQKAQGREILQGLEQKNALSNTALLAGPLAAASVSAPSSTSSVGVSASQLNVALLLPVKGQFSSVSFKINRGASAAQQVLAKSGVGVNVIPIDTETPGWQQKIAELPKNVIIGGPMSSSVYEQGKAASLWSGRAVFAFLPQLPASDEGTVAWRFFSSSQDQASALINFCRTLGINGIGTLYPSDSYGSRMEGVMQQAAVSAGISPISKNYTNPSAGDWDPIAKSFLAMRASSPFDAAFLPDTWGNAKALIPYIFYNKEDRLLLMGTGLWEQGLYKDRAPDPTYFHLAIFPGAWDPASSNAPKNELAATLSLLNKGGTGSGGADFWTALGFDFVRFAAKMGQPDGAEWDPSSVNSHISAAEGITFSMAPIHWSSGVASQEMFVLTPAENGFTKADTADFKQRLTEAKALHDKRWQDKKRK